MSRRRLVLAECLVVALLVAGGVAVRGTLVQRGWLFAGSDSYGYLHIADEWRHHGRFAFGPAPQPLQWYRRPLYPMFLVVARGDAPADPSGGAGWRRIEIAQMLLELFMLWPLLYLTLRRVAGVGAGLVGLSLALFYPPAVPFTLAVLTEPLAMTLALVAVAPLVWLPSRRAWWCWALAGAGVALSSLLRPDGLFYGAAIIPALFIREIPWRQRQIGAGIFALAFLVLFAPWPIRNWIDFGRAHLTDGMIDRFGNDIPDYRGFWDWMRTWSHDERAAGYAASCFYDPLCDARTEIYGALGAFDDAATSEADERNAVDALLDRRRHEGVTPAVSDGFERLAAARRRAHPWKVLVELPARRAVRAWWSAQSEIVDNHIAWPSRFSNLIPHFKRYGRRLFIAMIVSILILLMTPRFRMACGIVALPLLVRSLILGWTGFSLPRYVAPGYPLCFMLIAMAAYVVAMRGSSLVVAARRRMAAS